MSTSNSRKRKLSKPGTNGDLLEAKQKKSKSSSATNKNVKETLTKKKAKKPSMAAHSKTAPHKGTRVLSSPEVEDLDESATEKSGDNIAKSALDVVSVDDDDDKVEETNLEAAEESAEVELGTKLQFFCI